MNPALLARIMQMLGQGRGMGSFAGTKGSMISPPEAPALPTVPFSESNLGRMFSNMSGGIERYGIDKERSGGFDEAGFTGAGMPQTAAAPPLPPPMNIPSLPQPPASMQAQSLFMPNATSLPPLQPPAATAYAQAPQQDVTGPDLIKQFMGMLQRRGAEPDYERHAIKGW
jgi:hypothetical protein